MRAFQDIKSQQRKKYLRNAVILFVTCMAVGILAIVFPVPAYDVRSTIYRSLRIPRVILGGFVGGGLAVSGAVLQALLRNPLASPLTLGVAGGAAFGATIAMVLGLSLSLLGLPFYFGFAFVFALLTIFITYWIAKRNGKLHITVLLLAGVVLNFFYSALILFLQYISNYTRTLETVRWLMGNLSTVGYDAPVGVGILTITVSLWIYLYSAHLDLLTQGEEVAHSLGVSVDRTVFVLFVLVSLLTGGVVAITGPIGFIGLVVPHAVRALTGPSHKRLLPIVFMSGGMVLIIADWIARNFLSPIELPVGVITGLLGAPYFLWLLWKLGKTKGL